MEHPDDVSSPFRWLDGDSLWNDLLSMIFAGSAWPEGSETAVWDLAQEWIDLADGLSGASEGLQAAAADLLAAWDAPAAEGFDELARKLLGSPEFGLPGHIRNAAAIAQQTSGFGVDLQYAKISINVAVVVAAMAAVLAVITAIAGGVSLLTIGPIASTARQALITALGKLATAAGRKALVQGVERAVSEQATALAGRVAAHSTGHHLAHEIAEEVLEELVIDVTTQAWQMSGGTRTDWDVLSTVQAGLGGGFGGAAGAGLVAPVFARLRRSPRVTAIAGLGADGGRLARTGNAGVRHTGGLAATAGTNAVASPAGGIAASLLTGQGFPALDGSTFGMAALGAMGRYGTVSPTNPAVLSAAVHPVQTLSQVHLDALAGHLGQKAAEAARADAAGTTTGISTAPGTTQHGTTDPPRGTTGPASSSPASSSPASSSPGSSGPASTTARTAPAAAVAVSSMTAGTTTGGPSAAQPVAATASPTGGGSSAGSAYSADSETSAGSASSSGTGSSAGTGASVGSSSPAGAGSLTGTASPSAAPVSVAPLSSAPAAATSTGVASTSVAPSPSSVQSTSPTSSNSASPAAGQTREGGTSSPIEGEAGSTHTEPAGHTPTSAYSAPSEQVPAEGTSSTSGSPAAVEAAAPVATTGTPEGAAPTPPPVAAGQAEAAADARAEAGTSVDPTAAEAPTGTDPVAGAPARADRIEASLDRLAADLTAVAASNGGGPVSRADVERALLHQAAQTESQRTVRVRAREYALQEIAARKAASRVDAVGGTGRRADPAGLSGAEGRADVTGPQALDLMVSPGGVALESPADLAHLPEPVPALNSRTTEPGANARALADGTAVPIALSSVVDVAEALGLDVAGVDIYVATDPDDVRYYDHKMAMASTNVGPQGRPTIMFAPAAFVDDETLVRTVAHEMEHVVQLRAGRVTDTTVVDAMEQEADAVEPAAWTRYQEAGHVGSLHRDEDVPSDRDGADSARSPGRRHGSGDRDDPARRVQRDASADPLFRHAHARDTGGPGAGVVPAPGGRLGGGTRLGAGEPAGVAANPGSDFTSGAQQTGPASAPENGEGDPPTAPPTPEQQLYDGMPEPLRRYLMEAVAHGQVWADLVQHQLIDVYSRFQEKGLPAPEAVGLVNAVKSMESAARKIQPAIQGGSTFASAIWSMDDLVRFSLQIDPAHYGTSVLQALEAFTELGWSVPAVPGPGKTHDDWRNTWAVGNRHHGLLVVMTHGTTGQRVEVQFPTPKSWAVGKRTHDLYEAMRFEDGDPYDRVLALAQIRDIVIAEGVESTTLVGIDALGPSKRNGADRVFEKDVELAVDFLAIATRDGVSAEARLHGDGVSLRVAREVCAAATKAAESAVDQGGTYDEPASPGVGSMGKPPAGAREPSDKIGGKEPEGGSPGSAALPPAPGGPGPGASGHAGTNGRRGARTGEGLHLPDRDLAEARDEAGPGNAFQGGRGTGDDPVRRPERDLDLGSGERERDRAPGGRGPVRAAGAGDPGAGGGTGPSEGDDAAQPGTPAGDVPQPGGPSTGHVGDAGGPEEAAQPAALTGPLAVGADAAAAWQHVLSEVDPVVLWEGEDGALPGQVLMLADGSSVRVNTGAHSWARDDPDRPLQMWTVGAFHLDDGPLTPAAAAFLADLVTALEDPAAGGPGPSSHWLSQRATLDPATHDIAEPGVARPRVDGAPVLVWDAALGWVDAAGAGGLARVDRHELIPAEVFASWVDEPSAVRTVDGAGEMIALVREAEQAERLTTHSGTPESTAGVEARSARRADLRARSYEWVAGAVAPSVALFVDQKATVLAESSGRLLVELDHGRLAVVSIAEAENDALVGSRPGLQQSGTTSDIGQLRNELAAYPDTTALAGALTQELQQGAVRHFRVQGVLSDLEFVGMRVTEFEVTRPAHDEVGVRRALVEPHRHIDPGFAAHEAMRHAVAGWTPSSVTDAITNALRWLPFINPMHDRLPHWPRMPWSNNCADCTRAAADLMQGRDARAAFGDNGGRVLDDHMFWGTDPGELNEMWRYAGVVGRWHTWHGHSAVFSPDFTAHANARIGEALACEPEGTVAMVLVNWADTKGNNYAGHWFNAAVTDDGVEWVDGQSGQHSAWPPPYTTPYYGYAVITRAQDSDTWVDLFGGTGTAGNDPGLGGRSGRAESAGRRPEDAAFAARIANATGDWPEDDEDGRVHRTVWADGAGTTSTTVITVDAPTGESVQVEVRWIELPHGQRDVAVLSERGGLPFWWGAPEAVAQLLGRAHDVLRPDPLAWCGAVVLGTRPVPGAHPYMAQIPVRLVPGGAGEFVGTARVLPPEEVRSACATLRLAFDRSTGRNGVPVG